MPRVCGHPLAGHHHILGPMVQDPVPFGDRVDLIQRRGKGVFNGLEVLWLQLVNGSRHHCLLVAGAVEVRCCRWDNGVNNLLVINSSLGILGISVRSYGGSRWDQYHNSREKQKLKTFVKIVD